MRDRRPASTNRVVTRWAHRGITPASMKYSRTPTTSHHLAIASDWCSARDHEGPIRSGWRDDESRTRIAAESFQHELTKYRAPRMTL